MSDGLNINSELRSDLYDRLQALVEYGFPKTCAACHRTYNTLEEYLRETTNIKASTGLTEVDVVPGQSKAVGLWRNCACKSTLMIFCSDRRDMSEAGLKRREAFGIILQKLIDAGMEPEAARNSLLAFVRGDSAEILTQIREPLPGELLPKKT